MELPSLVELCFNVLASENFIQLNGNAVKELPVEVAQRLLHYMVQSVQSKVQSQNIALKIHLVRQNRLVTFRLPLFGTIGQTVEDIYEKIGVDGNSGNERCDNYALFQKEGSFHPARWLQPDKTLSYYDLKPGATLEFKSKSQMVKVHFWGPWTTYKTFIVDESKPVTQLTQSIAQKIGILNGEEFSLQIARGVDTTAGLNRWLNPDETLPEQGASQQTTLYLRKKEFFRELDVKKLDDEENLTREFCQSLDTIIAGTCPCTREEAITFATLQCQIRFGDCSSTTDEQLADFSWEEYLPWDYVSVSKKMEKEILAGYKRLAGMNAMNAKYRYILHARSLPTHGYTFFKVEKVSKDQVEWVLLGFSKENVMVLDAENKSAISCTPIALVTQWKVLNNSLTISFMENSSQAESEEFTTTDTAAISQVLADYIYYNVEKAKKLRKKRRTSGDAYRPGSPPNSLTLKDRESMARKLTSMGKSLSFEQLFGTVAPGMQSPTTKKSPIYVDPNKLFVNPLFTDGFHLSQRLDLSNSKISDELNYYLKMIRSVSCLKNILKQTANKEMDIQVKFPDKSVKTFTVDMGKTVADLAQEIGEKVGMKNPEEFSLQHEKDSDEATNSEVWLNPYQTLQDQGGIAPNCSLLFKKKFYYHDAFIGSRDPVYFNLLFCQSHTAITNGTYPCKLSEGVQLAATQFQINFGDHNPNIHQPGFLGQKDLKLFLPTECLEFWGVTFQKLERMIYKEHQKLRGIKEEYAKYRYLQLCRSLHTYGTVFFSVKLQQHKGKLPKQPSESLLVGFSRDSILFLTANLTKKVTHEFPLTHLRKWEGTNESFMLDFGDYEEGTFIFLTSDGQAMSKYLSDYFDFIQKNSMVTQTFNTNICKYPPENNIFLAESNSVCCWENGKRVFTSSFLTL